MNAVYLVGGGCGAGSLTLRGAQLIGQCDCLVYDSLIDGGILSLVKPSCKKIFAGKRAGRHGMKQEEIAQRLQVSQVQVSRLERKVLSKLKTRLVHV